MQTDSAVVVVCDAGPLIHLDQFSSLELLADMGRIVVPAAVWDEVKRHRPTALTTKKLSLECVAVNEPLEAIVVALARVFSLDTGEREALSLMREFPSSMFLTDDAAARLVSMQLGHEVHGTIGVLIRAVRRGLRTSDQVAALLAEIPTRSTLYIRQDLLEKALQRVKAANHLTA